MTSPTHRLSMNKQLRILGLSKSAVYYKPKGECELNDKIMKMIDKEHLKHPTKGVVGMRDWLRTLSIVVGVKRVRRLMRLMNIQAVYPSKKLSTLGNAAYKRPYLLRHLTINHPNQVWSIDITYIPMQKGFMYLTAIIDIYSRCIVGWGLHNNLDKENCLEVLSEAIARHGAPEVINSDQGCQFTSKLWIETCENHGIIISMDGRARCLDNIWIERFWRTIKREYIYLNPANNGQDLYNGIRDYMHYYNFQRPHQSLDNHNIPINIYKNCNSKSA